MNKRTEKIEKLSDLEIEIVLLGSDYNGESGLILFNDVTRKVCLFSFLIDSFAGIYDYVKQVKSEMGSGFGKLSCICWTHPHEDHTEDLLTILKDETITSLNKKSPLKYDDTTRFIIPGHLKPNNGYEFHNPGPDFNDIIAMGGSIGIMVDERMNKINHCWYIEVANPRITIPIYLTFITPMSNVKPFIFNSRNFYQNDYNLLSLSFVMKVGDFLSLYWGGDCSSESINNAIKESQKGLERKKLIESCNIVKIPHHGSCKSIDLTKIFQNLDYAIVTCDERSNLPHKDVLQKYTQILPNDTRLLQTKECIKDGDNIGEVKILITFPDSEKPFFSTSCRSFNSKPLITK